MAVARDRHTGLTVVKPYRPSASVADLPKPVKPVERSRRNAPAARGMRPAPSGCQSSTSASGTASPAPSYTVPCNRTASGVRDRKPDRRRRDTATPGRRTDPRFALACRPIRQSACSSSVQVRPGAEQHDVPSVAGRVLRLGQVVVVARRSAVGARRDRGSIERMGSRSNQRVARKVHLGDQPLRESGSEDREVDVRRPPRVAMVAPRIGPGLMVRKRYDPSGPVRQRPAPVKFGSSGAGCWSSWWR